jgi:tetratricopeptide (TPR) repeat protein
MAIEGPLKELGIHDVFQLLDLSRKTGVLRVSSELRQNAGTVVFTQGSVVSAEIRSNPHPLGSVLLSAGKITQEDLTRARDMQKAGDPRRLGEVLVEIGAVSRRELARQVRAQVEEVIFELRSWSEGYFSFEEGAAAEGAEADVRITTEALMMEGARRIDEWSQIQQRIPHLGIIPRLAAGTGAGMIDLLPEEWEVLAAMDGERDVRLVAEALGRSEFDVAKTLFGLASAGVVILEAPAPSSAPGAGPGRELAILIARTEDRLASGDAPAALLAAQEVVASHPHEPMAHLVLGRGLLAVGRTADAAESFRRALQYDSGSATAHRLLGLSLLASGRLAEGAEQLDRWSALSDLPPEEQQAADQVDRARHAARLLDDALRGKEGP